jgi:hypothetical protein
MDALPDAECKSSLSLCGMNHARAKEANRIASFAGKLREQLIHLPFPIFTTELARTNCQHLG